MKQFVTDYMVMTMLRKSDSNRFGLSASPIPQFVVIILHEGVKNTI